MAGAVARHRTRPNPRSGRSASAASRCVPPRRAAHRSLGRRSTGRPPVDRRKPAPELLRTGGAEAGPGRPTRAPGSPRRPRSRAARAAPPARPASSIPAASSAYSPGADVGARLDERLRSVQAHVPCLVDVATADATWVLGSRGQAHGAQRRPRVRRDRPRGAWPCPESPHLLEQSRTRRLDLVEHQLEASAPCRSRGRARRDPRGRRWRDRTRAARRTFAREGSSGASLRSARSLEAVHREDQVEALEVLWAHLPCDALQRDSPAPCGLGGPRVGWLPHMPPPVPALSRSDAAPAARLRPRACASLPPRSASDKCCRDTRTGSCTTRGISMCTNNDPNNQRRASPNATRSRVA